MALGCKAGQKLKKNPPNIIKASSQTPKKFFVCYSVAVRVQDVL
jgi:hypothetical protein